MCIGISVQTNLHTFYTLAVCTWSTSTHSIYNPVSNEHSLLASLSLFKLVYQFLQKMLTLNGSVSICLETGYKYFHNQRMSCIITVICWFGHRVRKHWDYYIRGNQSIAIDSIFAIGITQNVYTGSDNNT